MKAATGGDEASARSGVDHALLTRFNLPSAGSEARVRAQEDWLRDRVGLFERYCLPSVLAQNEPRFSWLVYFDPASPAWLRARIDRWVAESGLTPRFRAEVPRATLLRDLEAVTGRSHDELITTNLDNDDGLARDFTARVRAAATVTGRTALYCRRGLVVTPEHVYVRDDPRNAFCSVREPWAEAMTCWSQWHNLLGNHMAVVELGGAAAWLQVVHGANVSNRVRGQMVLPQTHRHLFPGLLDDLPAVTTSALRRDRLLGQPLRTGRDLARTGLRSAALRVGGKDGLDRAKVLYARVSDRVHGRPPPSRPGQGRGTTCEATTPTVGTYLPDLTSGL